MPASCLNTARAKSLAFAEPGKSEASLKGEGIAVRRQKFNQGRARLAEAIARPYKRFLRPELR